jgi:hypothetical protein
VKYLGAFRDLIPAHSLDKQQDGLQRGRGHQCLLPDFRLELPNALGQPLYQLAELKVIGAAGQDWYPRSGQCARRKIGVERRKERLQGEYRRPLEKPDRAYHGTQPGQLALLSGNWTATGLFLGSWLEPSRRASMISMLYWRVGLTPSSKPTDLQEEEMGLTMKGVSSWLGSGMS